MISQPLVASLVTLSLPRAINGFIFQSSSFLAHLQETAYGGDAIVTTTAAATSAATCTTVENLATAASLSSHYSIPIPSCFLIYDSPSSALSLAMALPTSISIPDAFLDPIFYQHMATGAALAFAGDVIAQSLLSSEHGKNDNQQQQSYQQLISIPPKDWDIARTSSFVAFGALYTGGCQHFIFDYLNTNFDEPMLRLAMAQFFFIPFCYYPTFLAMTPTLRAGWEYGFGTKEATLRRKELFNDVAGKIPSTLIRNWCFWLPVQLIQFNFIPANHHVTFTAAFGVVWNAILSWSTASSTSSKVAVVENKTTTT